MTDTPSLEYSKAKLQTVLTEAGIDFAKSWNKGQLVDAWNSAQSVPADNGAIHMSFGPIPTKFMRDAGYPAERTSTSRSWFAIDPNDAGLLDRLAKEIETQQAEGGDKTVARALAQAQDRITVRL